MVTSQAASVPHPGPMSTSLQKMRQMSEPSCQEGPPLFCQVFTASLSTTLISTTSTKSIFTWEKCWLGETQQWPWQRPLPRHGAACLSEEAHTACWKVPVNSSFVWDFLLSRHLMQSALKGQRCSLQMNSLPSLGTQAVSVFRSVPERQPFWGENKQQGDVGVRLCFFPWLLHWNHSVCC